MVEIKLKKIPFQIFIIFTLSLLSLLLALLNSVAMTFFWAFLSPPC